MNNRPHPFTLRPHRTLLILSLPVLLSMTAEPITALVDTAFVASLGSVALAALGVGTTALTSLFWVFNFLGIGAQTEVAQADGQGKPEKAGGIASLALTMATGFGILLILLLLPILNWLAELLGASGAVQMEAVNYMQIRLYGAPAVLLMLVTFGVLRGLQDMRTPLWIAVGFNLLNVLLDWLLIFGNGPFPAMGVSGSALASTVSQWLGALAGVTIVAVRLGLSVSFTFRDVTRLLSVGGDLFVRTGLLTFFLAYTTRAATRIGADAGAAHQAIRQVYGFTSLALDAYAATVQSLVGYFVGRNAMGWVKRVVRVGASWSLWTGVALGGLMWLGRGPVAAFLIPETAVRVFLPAWAVSAMSQPVSSLAFLTDGVHWGTGDYRFLRNAMIVAALVGFGGISLLEFCEVDALYWVWIVVGIWVTVRALFGMLRIWPGIGNSVFREKSAERSLPDTN
ncbi:MAG: MATE family efflux transporter [Anaerolineales bacterium]